MYWDLQDVKWREREKLSSPASSFGSSPGLVYRHPRALVLILKSWLLLVLVAGQSDPHMW